MHFGVDGLFVTGSVILRQPSPGRRCDEHGATQATATGKGRRA